MRKRLFYPCLLATFLILGTTHVFAQRFTFGTSFSYLNPVKEFEIYHNDGFGVKMNGEIEVTGPLSITAEFGYNKWVGGENGDLEAWDAVGGLKLNLFGPLYTEGRAGFYFGEQWNQFVFIPSAGLNIRRFDFNLGYQVLYDKKFVDVRVGFLWGGRKK